MHLIIISKRNTACPRNRLGILIWIFLHQVLDYHDVSMKAYLDLTLYMILHCSCLVWTALYSLYMTMYVQKSCSRGLHAAAYPQSRLICPPFWCPWKLCTNWGKLPSEQKRKLPSDENKIKNHKGKLPSQKRKFPSIENNKKRVQKNNFKDFKKIWLH